jgi:hypothetical protein
MAECFDEAINREAIASGAERAFQGASLLAIALEAVRARVTVDQAAAICSIEDMIWEAFTAAIDQGDRATLQQHTLRIGAAARGLRLKEGHREFEEGLLVQIITAILADLAAAGAVVAHGQYLLERYEWARQIHERTGFPALPGIPPRCADAAQLAVVLGQLARAT